MTADYGKKTNNAPTTTAAAFQGDDIPTLDAATDMNELVDRAIDCLKTKQQRQKDSKDAQIFIGVGGAPGSGKSTIVEKVVKEINTKLKTQAAILLPMDGYHYTKEQVKHLAANNLPRGYQEVEGNPSLTVTDYLRRKGAPWTIDAHQLLDDLRHVQTHHSGSFPLYDRAIHDSVPNQLEVTSDHSIIFVEGLYTLALEHPVWKPLGEIWDDRWFIVVPKPELKERLIQRHLKHWDESKEKQWGKGREGATAKTEDSDYKNADWVIEKSAHHANLLIRND